MKCSHKHIRTIKGKTIKSAPLYYAAMQLIFLAN